MEYFDIVGVGFGPSNVALAIALQEQQEEPSAAQPSVMFIERQPAFSWHEGMLIPGSRMQIAFLKDLVTPRNARSKYTFIAYLQERGRLNSFINQQDFFPTRAEFHDYMNWVAEHFRSNVRYGHEVVEVNKCEAHRGMLEIRHRHAQDRSQLRRVCARNVVLATGLTPKMPLGVESSSVIWHSSEFLINVARLNPRNIKSVAVVGSGQSAAEILNYIYHNLAGVQLHAIVEQYGFVPADDSPFVNALFSPEAVDEFFAAPTAAKDYLNAAHRGTNYSVVDRDLIKELHRQAYEGLVSGQARLRIHNMSRLVKAHTNRERRVCMTVHSKMENRTSDFEVDLLICATGYEQMDPRSVLGNLGRDVRVDEHDRCVVLRNHALSLSCGDDCGIFVQGGGEHTHGLSSSLLSNVAIRSGELAQTLSERLGRVSDAEGVAAHDEVTKRMVCGPNDGS
jgi:L-ornithine N5-oxygenase